MKVPSASNPAVLIHYADIGSKLEAPYELLVSLHTNRLNAYLLRYKFKLIPTVSPSGTQSPLHRSLYDFSVFVRELASPWAPEQKTSDFQQAAQLLATLPHMLPLAAAEETIEHPYGHYLPSTGQGLSGWRRCDPALSTSLPSVTVQSRTFSPIDPGEKANHASPYDPGVKLRAPSPEEIGLRSPAPGGGWWTPPRYR